MSDDAAVLDLRLAKALSHPLRQRLLMAYTGRVASPSQVADELDEPLGDVSYHTKRLLAHGCLELVRAERGRGGVKHFYRAAVPFEVEDAPWHQLSPALRRSVAEPVVAQIVEDIGDASAGGAFAAEDLHLARVRLDLDAEGWRELGALLRDTVAEAERLNSVSAARRGAQPGVRPSVLAVLHFPKPG
jgi:hypothetical protein